MLLFLCKCIFIIKGGLRGGFLHGEEEIEGGGKGSSGTYWKKLEQGLIINIKINEKKTLY